jgi:hypothetical protein
LKIDAVPVPVATVRVVQGWYIDVAAFDDPVVSGDYTSERSKLE